MNSKLNNVLLCWLISRRFGERRWMMEEEPRRRRRKLKEEPQRRRRILEEEPQRTPRILEEEPQRAPRVMEEEPQRTRRVCAPPPVAPPSDNGHFQSLFSDLRRHPDRFIAFSRLSVGTFDVLLAAVRSDLTYRDTSMTRSISAEERLLMTLRFLSTGNSFALLRFEFLLEISTISNIVHRTCEAIWNRLQPEVMPPPTAARWSEIADGFRSTAQFPHCLGALGGKHISVWKPPRSGSRYHRSKQYLSVVLSALADSNYQFVMVDIGTHSNMADARVSMASRMGQLLQSQQHFFPPPRKLPRSAGPPAPFVVVADEGFKLSQHLLRPFPRRGLKKKRRVFNYRLTRARRFVECAFGMLVAKWRVVQGTLQLDREKVPAIIQACVVLHNFSRLHDGPCDPVVDPPPNMAFGSEDCPLLGRAPESGLRIREQFADYFSSPVGSVPWQNECLQGRR
ncbi:uncharacterized protein [Eleutherodactylus coqui]|uniref:uncharacterized protein n=1 Tax=Eleutherodactylus coqui TaxID=57060 RepID=UPI003462D615